MYKMYQLFLVLSTIIAFNTSIMFNDVCAQPTAKLVIDPDVQEIRIGSELKEIKIVVRTDKTGLQFKWVLEGLGKFAGDTASPGIFYIPPDKIDRESAQATIIITVTDDNGERVTESVTFTLIDLTPKKMTTLTQTAIGAGAVAVLGGGIALLADDSGDSDGEPFTGTFKREFTFEGEGFLAFNEAVLDLTQNKEEEIIGNRVATSTISGCCFVSYSSPVTGTANGTSAVLSWGSGFGECECDGSRYFARTEGDTYNATLIDDGRILRLDNGKEYIRQ